MSHNNHHNSSCGYAEQLVSYLYDEADEREKAAFEAHLEICSKCVGELSDVGFARSAVLDWRTLEFSKLETPAFDIPFDEAAKSISPTAIQTAPRSWFFELKNLFSFNSALALTAAAILIFCSAAAIFLTFDFAGKTDIVAGNESNSIQAPASPANKSAGKPTTDKIVNNPQDSSPVSATAAAAPRKTEREKAFAPVKPTAEIAENSRTQNINSPRRLKDSSDNIKKSTFTKKASLPTINEAEDEPDETVRLADLFEEIDAK